MSAPLAAVPGVAAYKATALGSSGPGLAAPDTGETFAATLEGVMRDAVRAGRTADAASSSAIAGGTGTTDVVMAVTRAELALQTAVALRDRVVAAYQDVMRMQI